MVTAVTNSTTGALAVAVHTDPLLFLVMRRSSAGRGARAGPISRSAKDRWAMASTLLTSQ